MTQQGAGIGADGRFGVAPNVSFEVDVPISGTDFSAITNQTTSVTLLAGTQPLQTQSVSLSDLQNAGGSSVVTFYVTFDASLANTTQSLTATIDPQDVFNETTNSASVNVDVVSCPGLIDNSLSSPSFGTTAQKPPSITVYFTPNYNYTLSLAAQVCGFTGFDWQQTITNLPAPSPFKQASTNKILTAPPSFLDPPEYGYTYESGGDNSYPFFFDPLNGELSKYELGDNKTVLEFYDDPADPCLFGGSGKFCNGKTAPPGSVISFTTQLVGLNTNGTPANLGMGFSWTSSFNGTSGGLATTKNQSPPDAGSGTGGVTVVSVQQMTSYSGQGSSTPPTPPALSAGNSCNGTYSGTFNGNITVSTGQNCILQNATINGNIQMTAGSLNLSGVLVNGNVQIQNGGTFSINSYTEITQNLQIQNIPKGTALNLVCNSTVLQNVQIQGNGSSTEFGSTSASTCGGNVVVGNLQVQNNSGPTTIDNNTVSANLQYQNNSGAAQVYGNTVIDALQCSGNSAITGGSNTANQKQGQCSVF